VPWKSLIKINRPLFRFLWQKKDCNRRASEKVKRSVLCTDVECGGLNMTDLKAIFSSKKWHCKIKCFGSKKWHKKKRVYSIINNYSNLNRGSKRQSYSYRREKLKLKEGTMIFFYEDLFDWPAYTGLFLCVCAAFPPV